MEDDKSIPEQLKRSTEEIDHRQLVFLQIDRCNLAQSQSVTQFMTAVDSLEDQLFYYERTFPEAVYQYTQRMKKAIEHYSKNFRIYNSKIRSGDQEEIQKAKNLKWLIARQKFRLLQSTFGTIFGTTETETSLK